MNKVYKVKLYEVSIKHDGSVSVLTRNEKLNEESYAQVGAKEQTGMKQNSTYILHEPV